MTAFNDFAIARAVHVFAVLIWIGGVAFVTLVLLPACREMAAPRDQLELFERLEHHQQAHAEQHPMQALDARHQRHRVTFGEPGEDPREHEGF